MPLRFFPLLAFLFFLLPNTLLAQSPPFNEVFLKATHNSYANTPVGTIRQQLDAGCRIVELDIYDTELATAHDFLIGHSAPGNGDRLGNGNPPTPALSPWLKLINRWCDKHSRHAPIVIYFDLKNGSGYNNGSLALLDDEVSKIFGHKRYLAWQYPGAWPSVDDLRGKVMTVFTGGFQYRKAYRWDIGVHPVIAMNSYGQIIEIHESITQHLWYWIGQYEPDGTVAWRRHGQICPGVDPAVTIDDHGEIVEMHRDPATWQLLYCQGQLHQSSDVDWLPCEPFTEVTKIKFRGDLILPLLPEDRADVSDGRWVAVSTGPDAVAPAETLRYSTPTVTDARLTYEQRSFDEYDQGDPLLNRDGLLFYTAPYTASGITWGRAAREQGKIVRLWMFNSLRRAIFIGAPPANYPATDYPYTSWYDRYMQSLGAVR